MGPTVSITADVVHLLTWPVAGGSAGIGSAMWGSRNESWGAAVVIFEFVWEKRCLVADVAGAGVRSMPAMHFRTR